MGIKKIGNMVSSMPGNEPHADLFAPGTRKAEALIVLMTNQQTGERAGVRRANQHFRIGLRQVPYTADVIRVVMRNPDFAQGKAIVLQALLDDCGIARIDDDSIAAFCNQPYIIVFESRYAVDSHCMLTLDRPCDGGFDMRLPRLFKSPQSLRGGYIHELVDLWFDSAQGQEVLRQERILCEQILPDMFGYHLLQLGFGQPRPLCESSPIRHRVYIAEKSVRAEGPLIVSGLDDLAVATDSVDVALLHHCLDFTLHPQRVLREVSRVVIPGGKIVIVGFNPLSLWGLWRLAKAQSADVPWCGRFLSPYRVSDWLGVLDLHVDGYESTQFGLPVHSPRFVGLDQWLTHLGTRWWNHVGAVYVMVATKQVSRLTPVRPIVRAVKAPLIPIPLKTQPTSRNIHAGSQDSEEAK